MGSIGITYHVFEYNPGKDNPFDKCLLCCVKPGDGDFYELQTGIVFPEDFIFQALAEVTLTELNAGDYLEIDSEGRLIPPTLIPVDKERE